MLIKKDCQAWLLPSANQKTRFKKVWLNYTDYNLEIYVLVTHIPYLSEFDS